MFFGETFLYEELRAEAVKWIKAGKSVWINAEKFFNLTEEDLNGK